MLNDLNISNISRKSIISIHKLTIYSSTIILIILIALYFLDFKFVFNFIYELSFLKLYIHKLNIIFFFEFISILFVIINDFIDYFIFNFYIRKYSNCIKSKNNKHEIIIKKLNSHNFTMFSLINSTITTILIPLFHFKIILVLYGFIDFNINPMIFVYSSSLIFYNYNSFLYSLYSVKGIKFFDESEE